MLRSPIPNTIVLASSVPPLLPQVYKQTVDDVNCINAGLAKPPTTESCTPPPTWACNPPSLLTASPLQACANGTEESPWDGTAKRVTVLVTGTNLVEAVNRHPSRDPFRCKFGGLTVPASYGPDGGTAGGPGPGRPFRPLEATVVNGTYDAVGAVVRCDVPAWLDTKILNNKTIRDMTWRVPFMVSAE